LGYASQSSRNLYGYQAPTNELQSYFVRAAVNYQGKYLLTGTFRADGSTKFGSNNKYGYFPSFAAAWNISKENFMSNISAVSNVKLRLGWGQTGNQEFPAGASLYRQAVTGIGAISPVNVGNPDLKWESTTTSNAGLEFNVLNDRIGITVDYFNKQTKDVLFELNFPVPGGSGSVWKNLDGVIENKGVELAVNAAVVKQSDLQWNVGVNATLQKNMYTKQQGVFNTGELSGQGMTGAYAQRIVAGYPLNVYYLRDFQGIDANGQSKYKEDGYTLFYGESPNPSTLLGINTDLTYKKWSASANLNGAFGHYLYNNTANSVVPITNLGTRNVAKSFVNAAVKEDLSNPIAPSTRFIEKGDYLKLSNLSISYNLGTIAKVIKNARVSLNGQNLLVITKYTGFDPEVNTDKAIGGIPSQGIEYMPYPSSRRFQVAFNFSL
jgi:iron complex outermembrane receptor protein